MADNITLDPGTGGAVVATDEVGSAHYQWVKLAWGADGTATPATTAAGLPVQFVSGSSVAVSAVSGTVTVQATNLDIRDLTYVSDSVAAVQSGSWSVGVTGSVAVTDGGGALTVDGTVAISGTVTVSATGLDVRALASGTDSVAAVQSGTWTVTGAGGSFPVTDSGGSLTVDAPVGTPAFVRLSDGASAISTLPVSLASQPLPTGAATESKQDTLIGHVDGVEGLLTTIDADTSSLAGCVGGTEVQVDIVGSLPAGTAAIGKLAANSGVDIGDVDVTSLPTDTFAADATAYGKGVLIQGDDGTDRRAVLVGTDGHLQVDVLSAPTTAVTGTFWQATQPVSVAATVTVTGTGGSFPVTDSGGSLTVDAPVGTPVFVRLSDGVDPIATLPVSLASVPSHAVTNAGTFAVQAEQSGAWSVTANAGTNLNTSALALEAGGNLAGAATSLAVLDDWDEADRCKVNLIASQAGITGGAGAVGASTPRVTLASDDPAVAKLGTIDADTSALAACVAGSEVQVDIVSLPAVDTELPAAAALADGAANPTTPTVGAAGLAWNGTTWDRATGTMEGIALASATRTALTSSSNLTNYNCRGVVVYLNITAASGTGGLSLYIGSVDPISSNPILHNAAPTAITATGTYAYELYPGASTAGTASTIRVNLRTAGALPRTWFVHVVHGNASSYTYSVGYALIP